MAEPAIEFLCPACDAKVNWPNSLCQECMGMNFCAEHGIYYDSVCIGCEVDGFLGHTPDATQAGE